MHTHHIVCSSNTTVVGIDLQNSEVRAKQYKRTTMVFSNTVSEGLEFSTRRLEFSTRRECTGKGSYPFS